jgi:hypothetical protein
MQATAVQGKRRAGAGGSSRAAGIAPGPVRRRTKGKVLKWWEVYFTTEGTEGHGGKGFFVHGLTRINTDFSTRQRRGMKFLALLANFVDKSFFGENPIPIRAHLCQKPFLLSLVAGPLSLAPGNAFPPCPARHGQFETKSFLRPSM